MSVEAGHAAGQGIEINGREVIGRNLFVERLRFSSVIDFLIIFAENCIAVAHLGCS
jgi:hypothetical protein